MFAGAGGNGSGASLINFNHIGLSHTMAAGRGEGSPPWDQARALYRVQ